MLRSLVDNQVISNFIAILDTEDAKGQDLFISFLKSHRENSNYKEILLMCYENPCEFYRESHPKIKFYDFFKDPYQWVDANSQNLNLNSISSVSKESVVFIDSLTYLIKYFGFYTVYKQLNNLKNKCKKIIILGHCDILKEKELDELKSLFSAVVRFKECDGKERIIDFFCRKPGGKVVNQEEVVTVNDFVVSSKLKKVERVIKSTEVEEDMESLTTFKLGVRMSENERKARDELVLPYLRNADKGGRGDIIYYQEAEDDLEDDPDDDLDI